MVVELRRLVDSVFRGDSARSRLARGISWSVVGTFVTYVFKLAASVVVARLLGQIVFGELGVINSTVVTLGVFSGLGLGITATKYIAELRSAAPQRAGNTIGFLTLVSLAAGGVMLVALLLTAPWLAANVLDAPHLALTLRIGSLLLLLNSVNGVQVGALAGLEEFRAIAVLNAVEGVTHLPALALGAWLYGLPGVTAAYVAIAALKWGLSQLALQRAGRRHALAIGYQVGRAEWRVLVRFALPALIVGLAAHPFNWLARVLLANQPDGYAQVGIFNAAYTWTALLLFIPLQITRSSVPILASLERGVVGTQQFLRIVRLNTLLVLGACAAVATPLIVASRLIMRSYGPEFAQSGAVLVVLMLAYSLSALTWVFSDALTAIGRMWWQVVYFLVAGGTLIGALWLVGNGALGLAWAYMASFGVQIGMQLFMMRWLARSGGIGRAPVGAGVASGN